MQSCSKLKKLPTNLFVDLSEGFQQPRVLIKVFLKLTLLSLPLYFWVVLSTLLPFEVWFAFSSVLAYSLLFFRALHFESAISFFRGLKQKFLFFTIAKKRASKKNVSTKVLCIFFFEAFIFFKRFNIY